VVLKTVVLKTTLALAVVLKTVVLKTALSCSSEAPC
jgi:hypothetical protein